MATDSDNTRFDKKMRWIKNHPTLVFVLLGGVLVVALGQLTGAIDSIVSVGEKRLDTPSVWTIQVYHFKNWNSTAEEQKVGERFSDLVLDQLIDRDLEAQEWGDAPEEDLYDIAGSRGVPSPEVLASYRLFAPLIAVTGSVEKYANEQFLVQVRVTTVDQDQRIERLMHKELVVEATRKDMKQKAKVVAHEIYEATRNLVQAKEG